MKTESAAEIVARWFREVGAGANESLYLNVEADRAYISTADGEVCTLANDWDVLAEAADLESLSELLKGDLL